jgi:hypothetical protein
MQLSGAWIAVGAVVIAGAVVVVALSVFTGISETALLWIGVFFGVATGVAIVLTQREREQPKQTRRKRR